jgi:glycosyltransferase involved in cell wall biosynthesis
LLRGKRLTCVSAEDLNSRLLPLWALEVKLFDPQLGRDVDYFDLCPKTPMIFFNHYWEGVPSMPRWPETKPVYLMPNIEMFELTAAHYWRVDVVLCKTQECYDRVTQWYQQEGSPRDPKVFYTKHTSSDQTQFARKRLGEDAIKPKDFADIKFLHTAGTSSAKGTQQLLECWVLVPGLPPLDVYIDNKPFDLLFQPKFRRMLKYSRSPVDLHVGLVERSAFTKMTAEAAFFMCPSTSEGYGHYINQARASGAVVVTTDLSPMNELITNETGVLIPVERRKHPKMVLGGAYRGQHGLKDADGLVAWFRGPAVCEAVKELVSSTTSEQRAAMGENARRAYHEDTTFFANAMQELRRFARRGNP